MANPATGGTYEQILQPGLNDIAVRKGIVTDLLIRDYHGSMTDLSDPAVGLNADGYFTPFAQNGELRDDLLITAEGANIGLYHLGLLDEDGITYTPDVSVEEVMSAQRRRSIRVDISKEDDSLQITALESTPLIDFLNDDKPLIGLPDLGQVGYSSPKPAQGQLIERQIIALLFDGDHYAAKVFPRMARSDVGDSNWNKANPDRLQLTWRALLCPYAGYPVNTLREGAGWRALGGYPYFGLVAPVATQTGATTATVAHAVPTGIAGPGDDPWTYSVEKAVSPFTSWTAATVGSSNVVGTTVTHSITSLVTATQYKFRVTAEGSNELSATSAESNTITTA